MKIREFKFLPYSLKFKRPFITSKAVINERKGFLIYISDENRYTGLGDVAPFEEFGYESFKVVEKKLNELSNSFPEEINFAKKEGLEKFLLQFMEFPSVRSGIEQAIISLSIKRNKINPENFFGIKQKKIIHVNSLISFCSPAEAAKLSQEQIEKGFTTIKIKIGRENISDDYEVIKSIRKAAGDNINLRLDVNCKWSKEEAINNLKALEEFNIEYVEQPISSVYEFIELKKHVRISLAADESIRSYDNAVNIIKNKLADVLVLKPMMLGGISPTLKIIRLAEDNNIKVVITSSLESNIGRRAAVFCASVLKDDIACGLSTDNLFLNNIEENVFPIKDGKIFLNQFSF
jgi:o-succinylbenzoate synthase